MSEKERRLLLPQMISNYSFVPKRQQLQLLKFQKPLLHPDKAWSWVLEEEPYVSISKFPKCNWMEMNSSVKFKI